MSLDPSNGTPLIVLAVLNLSATLTGTHSDHAPAASDRLYVVLLCGYTAICDFADDDIRVVMSVNG